MGKPSKSEKEKIMDILSNKQPVTLQLSRVRTFLFGALALMWFAEMVQWGFLAATGGWQNIWKDFPADVPQLAAVLSITHAIRAAAKGALGVMAVSGLRSKSPVTRTALFISMALVPPLNIIFPCRADGFPLGTTAVAAIFSIILWTSFFLFKEPIQKSRDPAQMPPSRWEIFQYLWFALNSAVLTLIALFFLSAPRTALDFIFPGLSSLFHSYETGLASMTSSNLSSGTHLLALAIASWVATIYCRNRPILRKALSFASVVNAGLICLLPLRRVILEIGGSSGTSSILIAFAPLFVGWLLYTALSFNVEIKERQKAYI